MEDLLASIRRAIHEDIGGTTEQSRGVLFRGDMRELRVKVGGEISAATEEIQDLRDKISRARAVEPEPSRPRRLAARSSRPALRPGFAEADMESLSREAETVVPASDFWDDEPGMISAETQAAADNAFNKLAHSLLNRPMGNQSIEDMTRELLRGMLKHWLDGNLPGLVERLVREEIERVARRGR
ncbi:MAG: PopZ family protein [Methylocella sp.]